MAPRSDDLERQAEGHLQSRQIGDSQWRLGSGGWFRLDPGRPRSRLDRSLAGRRPRSAHSCRLLLATVVGADRGQLLDQPARHDPAADEPTDSFVRIQQPILLQQRPGPRRVALSGQGERVQQRHGLIRLVFPLEALEEADRPIWLSHHQGGEGGHQQQRGIGRTGPQGGLRDAQRVGREGGKSRTKLLQPVCPGVLLQARLFQLSAKARQEGLPGRADRGRIAIHRSPPPLPPGGN